MNSPVRFNETVACAMCGQFGAHEIDDKWLCVDCYSARGACCAEASHEPHWECRAVETSEGTAEG